MDFTGLTQKILLLVYFYLKFCVVLRCDQMHKLCCPFTMKRVHVLYNYKDALVVGSVNTLHIHALLTAANLFASATLK